MNANLAKLRRNQDKSKLSSHSEHSNTSREEKVVKDIYTFKAERKGNSKVNEEYSVTGGKGRVEEKGRSV